MPGNFSGSYYVLAKIDALSAVTETIENDTTVNGNNIWGDLAATRIALQPTVFPTAYLASKTTQEKLFKATFRRPARQDIDLSAMPGNMPALSKIKVLPYNDVKWDEARSPTLSRIKTAIQNTR